MRALERSGDRPAAIQHAGLHGRLLQQELGAPPDPEVTALAHQMLTAPLLPPEAARAADTAVTADAAVSADVESAKATPRRRTAASAATTVTAVTAVAIALASLVVFTAAEPAMPITTMAVLPFENLSADADVEYLSDGITEEIGAALGRMEGLRVAAHTSAFSFKGQRVDVREVGRRLSVGAVLEGSVRKMGPRLRVTTRLVETAQGYQLWSETYERDFEDAFAVQQAIAEEVAARLRGNLGAGIAAPVVERGAAPDAESYDLYLKGRYAWHRRTAASLLTAVDLLRQAAEPRAALGPGSRRAGRRLRGLRVLRLPAPARSISGGGAHRTPRPGAGPGAGRAPCDTGLRPPLLRLALGRGGGRVSPCDRAGSGVLHGAPVVRQPPHRDGPLLRSRRPDARGPGARSAVPHRQRRPGLEPVLCPRVPPAPRRSSTARSS